MSEINRLMLAAQKKESQKHFEIIESLNYEYTNKLEAEYMRHKLALEKIEGGAEDAEDARKEQ